MTDDELYDVIERLPEHDHNLGQQGARALIFDALHKWADADRERREAVPLDAEEERFIDDHVAEATQRIRAMDLLVAKAAVCDALLAWKAAESWDSALGKGVEAAIARLSKLQEKS